MTPVRRAGLDVSLKSELTIHRDRETLTRARRAEKYRPTHPLPTPPSAGKHAAPTLPPGREDRSAKLCPVCYALYLQRYARGATGMLPRSRPGSRRIA
eukprot:3728788-Prymnesium_polylepis.1